MALGSVLANVFGLLCILTFAKGQGKEISRVMTLGDNIDVKWIANFETEVINFTVTAKSTGFIGFGLSPQGGMVNADVIIGGVKDGEPYFDDRWATAKAIPEIDEIQNWFLIHAEENATHTILEFYRNFSSCDDKDWSINNDTTKFIWALGSTDTLEHHAERGVASVNILDPYTPPIDTEDFHIWHINVNTTISTGGKQSDTSYWCTGHKSDLYKEKRHIVGFKVKLDNDLSIMHNHHMILHQCQPKEGSPEAQILEDFLKTDGDECYEDPMQEVLYYCQSYLFVWAKGGDALFLPEKVGFPLNENGTAQYFLLEIHYDNPKSTPGIQYETGIEVYTTPATREVEAGLLVIGHDVSSDMIIPPGSTDYVISGHCSSRCTEERLDDEGIYFFNVLLHAHLSGRKLKIRHFRPDETGHFQELPWVSYDNMYDFNYQSNRALREHLKVLPGDHFTYECNYDSTWRNPPSATLGGLSTYHEMCETFVMYYPRKEIFERCGSAVGLQILDSPGIPIEELDFNSDFRDPLIFLPEEYRGQNLSTVLTSLTWTDQMRSDMQKIAQYSEHYEICMGFNEQGEPVRKAGWGNKNSPSVDYYNTTYPEGFDPYVPPTIDCDPDPPVEEDTTPNGSGRFGLSSLLLPFLFIIFKMF